MTHELKEHPDNIPLMLDGAMNATLRHKLEYAVSRGDAIRFVNAETGEAVLTRTVRVAARAKASDIPALLRNFNVEYPDRKLAPILQSMNRHYDDTITEDTTLDALIFDPENDQYHVYDERGGEFR